MQTDYFKQDPVYLTKHKNTHLYIHLKSTNFVLAISLNF